MINRAMVRCQFCGGYNTSFALDGHEFRCLKNPAVAKKTFSSGGKKYMPKPPVMIGLEPPKPRVAQVQFNFNVRTEPMLLDDALELMKKGLLKREGQFGNNFFFRVIGEGPLSTADRDFHEIDDAIMKAKRMGIRL